MKTLAVQYCSGERPFHSGQVPFRAELAFTGLQAGPAGARICEFYLPPLALRPETTRKRRFRRILEPIPLKAWPVARQVIITIRVVP